MCGARAGPIGRDVLLSLYKEVPRPVLMPTIAGVVVDQALPPVNCLPIDEEEVLHMLRALCGVDGSSFRYACVDWCSFL